MNKPLLVVLLGAFLLSACQTAPASQTVPQSGPQDLAPLPSPSPITARPGSLADSLLAAEWSPGTAVHSIFPVDAGSGAPLSNFEPIALGRSYWTALSPDRRTLAAVTFKSSDYPSDGELHLIDLQTWQKTSIPFPLKEWVFDMAFSPDGRYLAVTGGFHDSKIMTVDLEEIAMQKPAILAEKRVGAFVSNIRFSNDGKSLLLLTRPVNRFTGASEAFPSAAILSVVDLEESWSATLTGIRIGLYAKGKDQELHEPGAAENYSPGIVFDPARDILYLVHADRDKLTTVDFQQESVQTREIREKKSWFERLLAWTAGVAHAKVMDGTDRRAIISPDGKLIFTVAVTNNFSKNERGEWENTEKYPGLDIIRTDDAVRIQHLDTEASELSLSGDGKLLFLRGWSLSRYTSTPWTEIFDISSGQIVINIEDAALVPSRMLDGEEILVSNFTDHGGVVRLAIFDPRTLSPVAQWQGSNHISWLLEFP